MPRPLVAVHRHGYQRSYEPSGLNGPPPMAAKHVARASDREPGAGRRIAVARRLCPTSDNHCYVRFGLGFSREYHSKRAERSAAPFGPAFEAAVQRQNAVACGEPGARTTRFGPILTVTTALSRIPPVDVACFRERIRLGTIDAFDSRLLSQLRPALQYSGARRCVSANAGHVVRPVGRAPTVRRAKLPLSGGVPFGESSHDE